MRSRASQGGADGTVHDATGSGGATVHAGTSESTADQIQPGASAAEAAEAIAHTGTTEGQTA